MHGQNVGFEGGRRLLPEVADVPQNLELHGISFGVLNFDEIALKLSKFIYGLMVKWILWTYNKVFSKYDA